MGLFDQFPYTNFHELNLDWLLKMMKELYNKVENFVALNTIKYADPIQWNITTQYEANTVVVDPQTGTAYISSKAVPAGVALSNADYWSVIFTLDLLSANKNLTLRDDGSNVLATFASAADDWLIWNGILYKVTQTINVNEAYVSGYNITRYTVEQFLDDAVTTLNNTISSLDNAINNKIGDLADLNTSDKTSVVNAINSIVSTISSTEWTTPEAHGAAGDGITNDTVAFQNAVDNAHIVVCTKNYLLNAVTISHDVMIIGVDGKITLAEQSNSQLTDNAFIIANTAAHVTITGIEFIGSTYSGSDTSIKCIIDADGQDTLLIENCTFRDSKHGYVNITQVVYDFVPIILKAIDCKNFIFRNNLIDNCGGDELFIIAPKTLTANDAPKITFDNNIFNNIINGASVGLYGTDIECNYNSFNTYSYPGSIFNLSANNHCTCKGNTFNDCTAGEVFDACEGAAFHAKHLTIENNYFDGTANKFINTVSNLVEVKNNLVNKCKMILFHELTIQASYLMPPEFQNTEEPVNACVIVSNNSFEIINDGTLWPFRLFAYGASTTPITPITDIEHQGNCIITNNLFKWASEASGNVLMHVTRLISSLIVKGNSFVNPQYQPWLTNTINYIYMADNSANTNIIDRMAFEDNTIVNDSTSNVSVVYRSVNDAPTPSIDTFVCNGNSCKNTFLTNVTAGTASNTNIIYTVTP